MLFIPEGVALISASPVLIDINTIELKNCGWTGGFLALYGTMAELFSLHPGLDGDNNNFTDLLTSQSSSYMLSTRF